MTFQPAYPYDIEDFKSKEYVTDRRREDVHHSAQKDAELFVAEYREALDTECTDWHADWHEKSWAKHRDGIPSDVSQSEINYLAEIYVGTLVTETERLINSDFLALVDSGFWKRT